MKPLRCRLGRHPGWVYFYDGERRCLNPGCEEVQIRMGGRWHEPPHPDEGQMAHERLGRWLAKIFPG